MPRDALSCFVFEVRASMDDAAEQRTMVDVSSMVSRQHLSFLCVVYYGVFQDPVLCTMVASVEVLISISQRKLYSCTA